VAEIFAAAMDGDTRTPKMGAMEQILMGLTDLKQGRQAYIT